MLEKNYVESILSYSDGELFWKFRPERSKAWNSRWVGVKSGYFDKNSGYFKIMIDKKSNYLHRIIALMHDIVGDEIDHIDCNTKNNLVENLRGSTKYENMRNKKIQSNNKTGVKGVTFIHYKNKNTIMIRANVTHNKKQYYKYFNNTDENFIKAHEWVLETRKTLHKDFLNNG